MHTQLSSGTRYLKLGLGLHLLLYFMYPNSEGFGETAKKGMLAWASADRLCSKCKTSSADSHMYLHFFNLPLQ